MSDAAQIDYPGVWRHRSTLVMLREARLPPICLKSGQPAMQWLQRELHWQEPVPFPGGVLALFTAIHNAKQATLMIGLSDEWAARRGTRMMTACVVGVVGVATGFAACILNGALGNAGWPLSLLPLALVIIAGGAVYGHFACRLVWPERITDKYLFLKGVHHSVRDQLPEWLD